MIEYIIIVWYNNGLYFKTSCMDLKNDDQEYPKVNNLKYNHRLLDVNDEW